MFLFAYAFPCFQTKLDKKLVQRKQTRETRIMFQACTQMIVFLIPQQ